MKKQTLVVITALALSLTGCSTSSESPASTSTAGGNTVAANTTTTSQETASPEGTETMTASENQGNTPIAIRIDGRTVNGTLSGNATARSLIDQLPLTLSFSEFGGQEKHAELPKPLSLEGVPAGDDADPLTIGYYAPGHTLVLYYEPVGHYTGIVRIGTFDDLAAIRDRSGRFEAILRIRD
ncbi:cyclophilin-like fold protein [Micrococcaceae bacterium Sec5.1]